MDDAFVLAGVLPKKTNPTDKRSKEIQDAIEKVADGMIKDGAEGTTIQTFSMAKVDGIPVLKKTSTTVRPSAHPTRGAVTAIQDHEAGHREIDKEIIEKLRTDPSEPMADRIKKVQDAETLAHGIYHALIGLGFNTTLFPDDYARSVKLAVEGALVPKKPKK